MVHEGFLSEAVVWRLLPRPPLLDAAVRIVESAVPAGDAAHLSQALWGVTAAGAGRHGACGGRTLCRASNCQLPPCCCQTCRTPILVLVSLPSVSLSDVQVWRAIASVP